jgi:hypothetical protein
MGVITHDIPYPTRAKSVLGTPGVAIFGVDATSEAPSGWMHAQAGLGGATATPQSRIAQGVGRANPPAR